MEMPSDDSVKNGSSVVYSVESEDSNLTSKSCDGTNIWDLYSNYDFTDEAYYDMSGNLDEDTNDEPEESSLELLPNITDEQSVESMVHEDAAAVLEPMHEETLEENNNDPNNNMDSIEMNNAPVQQAEVFRDENPRPGCSKDSEPAFFDHDSLYENEHNDDIDGSCDDIEDTNENESADGGSDYDEDDDVVEYEGTMLERTERILDLVASINRNSVTKALNNAPKKSVRDLTLWDLVPEKERTVFQDTKEKRIEIDPTPPAAMSSAKRGPVDDICTIGCKKSSSDPDISIISPEIESEPSIVEISPTLRSSTNIGTHQGAIPKIRTASVIRARHRKSKHRAESWNRSERLNPLETNDYDMSSVLVVPPAVSEVVVNTSVTPNQPSQKQSHCVPLSTPSQIVTEEVRSSLCEMKSQSSRVINVEAKTLVCEKQSQRSTEMPFPSRTVTQTQINPGEQQQNPQQQQHFQRQQHSQQQQHLNHQQRQDQRWEKERWDDRMHWDAEIKRWDDDRMQWDAEKKRLDEKKRQRDEEKKQRLLDHMQKQQMHMEKQRFQRHHYRQYEQQQQPRYQQPARPPQVQQQQKPRPHPVQQLQPQLIHQIRPEPAQRPQQQPAQLQQQPRLQPVQLQQQPRPQPVQLQQQPRPQPVQTQQPPRPQPVQQQQQPNYVMTQQLPLQALPEKIVCMDMYYKLRGIFPQVDPDYIKELCPSQWNGDDKDAQLAPIIEHLLERGPLIEDAGVPIAQAKNEPGRPLNSIDDIYENLLGIFPNADPHYLREFAEKNVGNADALKNFVELNLENRTYPTRDQYMARLKITEQQKQYTTGFDVKQFLSIIPDPFKHFLNPQRKGAHSTVAFEFLKSHFNKIRVTTISKIYNDCYHNLSLTASGLENITPEIKFKRGSYEIPTENIQLLQEIAFIKNKQVIGEYMDKVKKQEQDEFNLLKESNMLVECQCCYDAECVPSKCSSCENGHLFCNSCIVSGTNAKMGDGETRISCFVNCGSEFSLSALQRVLAPTTFSILLKKRQAAEVMEAGLEGLVACPFCHFASIPPETDKIFKCLNPECTKESCRLCKELSHVPLKCDEVLKADRAQHYVEEKMTAALARQCYQCKKSYFKEEGCNKINCPCGAMMCYLCDQPIKDYKHFRGQGSDAKHLCPLYSDTIRLDAVTVATVAKQAEQEVLKLNPNIKVDMSKLIPNIPRATYGPHVDVYNADELPRRTRRVFEPQL